MSYSTAAQQHSIIGASATSDKRFNITNHPGAQWFKNGNLGLFIHWGICTVRGDIDLSWGMIANKPWELKLGYDRTVTPNEYYALANDFKPDNFEIDELIRLAKEAGFTYAVFTTKHHDGYAMWPSKYGELNISKYMENKDFVREYVDACNKYGLKVGLYYSPPDWYYKRKYMNFNFNCESYIDEEWSKGKDTRSFDMDHNPYTVPELPPEVDRDFHEYVRNQIIELLTEYGKVDMIWFDGGIDNDPSISIEEIRELQPHILINPRLHGVGDFDTIEVNIPTQKPDAELWEHCNIWAEGPWWAYMKGFDYQSAKWAYDLYKEMTALGGNTLLNVSMLPDGTNVPQVVERLKEFKQLRDLDK